MYRSHRVSVVDTGIESESSKRLLLLLWRHYWKRYIISHLLRKVWGLNTNPKVRLSSSYLFPVVFVSLQHGHPRPCRGELSKHVHGDARPAGDEDADVVGFQIRSNHRFHDGPSFDDISIGRCLLRRRRLQGGRRRVVLEGRERTRGGEVVRHFFRVVRVSSR